MGKIKGQKKNEKLRVENGKCAGAGRLGGARPGAGRKKKNGKLRVENGKCGGGRPGEVKLLNKDVFLDEESATKAFAKFCNAKFFKGNCCGCPIVKHKNCSIAFMFTAVEGSAK